MSHKGGNVVPEVTNEEHDHNARAKRVILQSYNPGEAGWQPFVSLEAGRVKFDADDSAPTYIGINADPDATDAATDWTVFKFTYSGSAVTAIQRKVGAWSNRASLF